VPSYFSAALGTIPIVPIIKHFSHLILMSTEILHRNFIKTEFSLPAHY